MDQICNKLLIRTTLITYALFCTWMEPSLAYLATTVPLRIDCGNLQSTHLSGFQVGDITWQADQYFVEGIAYNITTASIDQLNIVESTLRAFPASNLGCYDVPRPSGRYMVRLGFAYFNYDSLLSPPVFDVLVQNSVVETVDMQSVENHYQKGTYYTDYIAYAPEGKVSVCLKTLMGTPIVNTLEILPVDTEAYDAEELGHNIILSTYVRINLGGSALGPEPADPGFRTWLGDVSAVDGNYTQYTTNHTIANTDESPEFLPMTLFQSAREAKEPYNATGFQLTVVPVDRENQWYIRYYFAEMDPDVVKGERIFDIILGTGGYFKALEGQTDSFDILANTTSLTAMPVSIVFNYTEYQSMFGDDLEIGVKSVVGSTKQALINGVELFEIIVVPGQLSNHTYGGSALSGGDIAGIVIGTLVGVIILFFFCCCCLRRRQSAGNRGVSGFGPFGQGGGGGYNYGAEMSVH
eukprot:TRINITY_DN3022_c0_g1_i2.p1 TRINITY_DN3022_c0_g1~~TRINITY_DN3022_c0_g1_i2.p1  ORF type:complete len:466 (-),score=57.26 TRINITY_DN3022_c0_g1_i2:282-1679(-)